MSSPFHEGEQRIQARLGVREKIEPWARRIVRPAMPEEHRAFYAQLPFVVLAARDAAGRPWATGLAEEPGFVSSPEPRSLHVAAAPSPGDALDGALGLGDDVGLLGIELHTRRRNRVNGRVTGGGSAGFTLGVAQSFGNCPQYITERRWRRAARPEHAPAPTRGTALAPAHRALIERADTFFIASGFRGDGESPVFGMDASHRGGARGFVEVRNPGELVFPDYAGNNHFNTLGNLLMDPRAGLLFVDFERGDTLQLTGRARIDWDSPDIQRHADAQRLVHFEIEESVLLAGALPLRWERPADARRELRLVQRIRESADVVSFVLAARDGRSLPDFAPGQYLPIELEIPGRSGTVARTYSLSGSPAAADYRLTVKRDPHGLVSRHLHDDLQVGQSIVAGSPQGTFTLAASGDRPVVLASAGIGLTPMVSMLHALASRPAGRDVWFVHGARDGDHHPLRREVQRLVAASRTARLHVAYSQPRSTDRLGRDHHSVGRVDGALLEKLLPDFDAEFHLCGPGGFMAELHAFLDARGVPAERIHTESFGPSA